MTALQQLHAQVFKTLEDIKRLYGNDIYTTLCNLKYTYDWKSSRTLGQMKYLCNQPIEIKFNGQLITDEHINEMKDTAIHEIAHAVVLLRYGKQVRPHGKEWKGVMKCLGGRPLAGCSNVAVTKALIGVTPYIVKCDCGEQYVKKNIHNKLMNGTKFSCKICHKRVLLVQN